VCGDHGRGHEFGTQLRGLGLVAPLPDVAPEEPLIASSAHELALAQRRHGARELVALSRPVTFGHVVEEHEPYGVRDRSNGAAVGRGSESLPAPTLMPMIGQPVLMARSMTLQIFSPYTWPREPPKMVKSWEKTQT